MIGKATVAIVAMMGVLGVAAWRIGDSGILWVVGCGFVIIVLYLIFLAAISVANPDIAATEGPSYVESRRLSLGAKNIQIPPAGDLVPDPQNPTQYSPNPKQASE